MPQNMCKEFKESKESVEFMEIDDHVLEIVNILTKHNEAANKKPSHICRTDLGKEINKSLNRLYKSCKIKVGDTINDKYIKPL